MWSNSIIPAYSHATYYASQNFYILYFTTHNSLLEWILFKYKYFLILKETNSTHESIQDCSYKAGDNLLFCASVSSQ